MVSHVFLELWGLLWLQPLNAACDKAAAEAVAVEWAQGNAELCSCITAGGQHGSIPGSTLGFSLAYSSSPVGFCLEQ